MGLTPTFYRFKLKSYRQDWIAFIRRNCTWRRKKFKYEGRNWQYDVKVWKKGCVFSKSPLNKWRGSHHKFPTTYATFTLLMIWDQRMPNRKCRIMPWSISGVRQSRIRPCNWHGRNQDWNHPEMNYLLNATKFVHVAMVRPRWFKGDMLMPIAGRTPFQNQPLYFQ